MSERALIEYLHEIGRQRGIPVELLCSAIEESVAQAYRAHAGETYAVADVDRETGEIGLHRRRVVVESVEDPRREIARRDVANRYQLGDYLDVAIDLRDFGRIAALTAKRVIAMRVLEFERERVFQKYRALQGTLVTGLVQREIHGSTYVVFEDGNEAILPPSERSPRDRIATNDFITAELLGVYKTNRGPALILSRASATYVRLLLDAPSIVSAARNPGFVTILASSAHIQPTHVKNASLRIGGERIDVVRWSDDPAEVVTQIMPPGSETLAIDDARVIVVESTMPPSPLQISLAEQLVGWRVLAAEPGAGDVALEQHLASIAPIEETSTAIVDDELVRKLLEFQRERENAAE